MRIYEELFIVKPEVPEEEIDVFIEQMKGHIAHAGGTVDKVEKWGKRRLAYKVEKHKEGSYVLLQFTAGAEAVKEVERRLRVADQVIKFLTVRIDETLKRLEKRKKDRDKRAHRKASQPAAPAHPTAPPLFGELGEPEPARAAPGAPIPGAPAPAPAPAAAAPVAPAPSTPDQEGR
jgi:small subunit ribosomal protein S6